MGDFADYQDVSDWELALQLLSVVPARDPQPKGKRKGLPKVVATSAQPAKKLKRPNPYRPVSVSYLTPTQLHQAVASRQFKAWWAMPVGTWRNRDGTTSQIAKMADGHLQNSANMAHHAARQAALTSVAASMLAKRDELLAELDRRDRNPGFVP